jgi:hypothetical protein
MPDKKAGILAVKAEKLSLGNKIKEMAFSSLASWGANEFVNFLSMSAKWRLEAPT